MRGNDYHNNKLFLQIWLAELQLRCLKHPEYSHIRINGVHPGFVASGIWHTNDSKSNDISMRALAFFLRYIAISPQQGSLAITNAATSPECGRTTRGGKYPNRIWEAPPHSYCQDSDARSKLWIKLDQVLHLREKGLLEVLALWPTALLLVYDLQSSRSRPTSVVLKVFTWMVCSLEAYIEYPAN